MRGMIKTSGYIAILLGLSGIVMFSILAAITFGNADITIKEVYCVVLYKLFRNEAFSPYRNGAIHDVVWLIRLPRVLLAFTVGMGLAVCGAIMQAVVKNPLAEPYILGISSGASMGAAGALLFGLGYRFGTNSVGIMAFLGAIIAAFAVLLIANAGGLGNPAKLILAGMAVNAGCSAFANFAVYLSNDKNAAAEIMFWTLGSLGNAKWQTVTLLLPIMFAGTLIFWSQFRNLNMMLLGDEVSITLGTNLQQLRWKYMILVSLMVGFSVYAVGTIGFVGLIIPHGVRMIFGTNHKHLIPLCAFFGGIFLIWADVLCRIILKYSELPIGILVSIVGAPCFIYLMIKSSYRFGGEG